MNTLEAIAKRKSTRAFDPEKQMPEEALQEILNAGMSAPVGSGAYDTLHLTVIQDRALIEEIGDAVNELVFKVLGKKMNKKFGEPTMILVSAKPGHLPGIEMANAGCVLENMALAATSLEIDNITWGGAAAVIMQNEELKKKMNLPEGFNPVLAASFGYGISDEPAKSHSIGINRI